MPRISQSEQLAMAQAAEEEREKERRAIERAESLGKLRRDYRMACISQFVNNFKVHRDFEFDIEELEADLTGERPLSVIPELLGRLLNTLSNDRNANSKTWLPTLRRQYKRRKPDDNPFVKLVPESEIMSTIDEEAADDVEPKSEQAVETADAAAAPMQVDQPGARATPTEAAPEASTSQLTNVKEEDPKIESAQRTASPTPQLAEGTGDGARLVPKDVDWSEVDLDVKVQAIYDVVEWHMVEPERFRRHLKWEQEGGWRFEPIGSDAQHNLYYALEDSRMWIQRSLPTPPNFKAVVPPAVLKAELARRKRQQTIASKMKKQKVQPKTTPVNKSPSKGKPKGKQREPATPEPEAPAGRPPKRQAVLKNQPTPRSTRASRRTESDEVWQEVPKHLLDSWNNPEANAKAAASAPTNGNAKRKAREASDDSGLTSLSDLSHDSTDEADPAADDDNVDGTEPGTDTAAEETIDMKPVKSGSSDVPFWEQNYWAQRAYLDETDFVEWEAICLTYADWTSLAERFDGSKNKDERELREAIGELLPTLQAEFEEKEKAAELARQMAERKRSSRLIMKESAQEAADRLMAERLANTERFSRASRHRVRQLSEEPATSDRSTPRLESREDRLRKREEEKEARKLAAEQEELAKVRQAEREAAIAANGGVVPLEYETEEERAARLATEAKAERKRLLEEKKRKQEADKKAERKRRREEKKRLEQEEQEDWYLDCEICGKRGWNLDDGQDVVCCDRCEEWHHVPCHQQADSREGKPPVDYASVDFICKRCRADPSRKKINRAPPPKPPPPKKQRTSGPSAQLPQRQMDYPTLLNLVRANPAVMNQLPPNYQAHFAQVLRLPMPAASAAHPVPSQPTASTSAPRPSNPGFAPQQYPTGPSSQPSYPQQSALPAQQQATTFRPSSYPPPTQPQPQQHQHQHQQGYAYPSTSQDPSAAYAAQAYRASPQLQPSQPYAQNAGRAPAQSTGLGLPTPPPRPPLMPGQPANASGPGPMMPSQRPHPPNFGATPPYQQYPQGARSPNGHPVQAYSPQTHQQQPNWMATQQQHPVYQPNYPPQQVSAQQWQQRPHPPPQRQQPDASQLQQYRQAIPAPAPSPGLASLSGPPPSHSAPGRSPLPPHATATASPQPAPAQTPSQAAPATASPAAQPAVPAQVTNPTNDGMDIQRSTQNATQISADNVQRQS